MTQRNSVLPFELSSFKSTGEINSLINEWPHMEISVSVLVPLCPNMEIPEVINIKPISWNAHIWTYCVSPMWSVYDARHL